MGTEYIDLCTHGDRVALLLWLRHKETHQDILVANTHLSFPHDIFDRMNQVKQMKKLASAIEHFAISHGMDHHAPYFICGDFNVEALSPVCDHLKSSGYVSCLEMSPPAGCLEENVNTATFTTTSTTEQQQHRVTAAAALSEACLQEKETMGAALKNHPARDCEANNPMCDDIGDDMIPSDLGMMEESTGGEDQGRHDRHSPPQHSERGEDSVEGSGEGSSTPSPSSSEPAKETKSATGHEKRDAALRAAAACVAPEILSSLSSVPSDASASSVQQVSAAEAESTSKSLKSELKKEVEEGRGSSLRAAAACIAPEIVSSFAPPSTSSSPSSTTADGPAREPASTSTTFQQATTMITQQTQTQEDATTESTSSLQCSSSQRPATAYVSHLTHRAEQLGVDHIFVKPNRLRLSFESHQSQHQRRPLSPGDAVGQNNEDTTAANHNSANTNVQSNNINNDFHVKSHTVSLHSAQSQHSAPPAGLLDTVEEMIYESRAGDAVEGAVDSSAAAAVVGINHADHPSRPSSQPQQDAHYQARREQEEGGGTSLSPAHNETDSSSSNAEGTGQWRRTSLVVKECQVLPVDVLCREWLSNFTISDHRPVRARLTLIDHHVPPTTAEYKQ